MVKVWLSRFTPGAKWDQVHLGRGEVVPYLRANGETVNVTIDSEIMSHTYEGETNLGFEAISESGERVFIAGERILGWDGRDGVLSENSPFR